MEHPGGNWILKTEAQLILKDANLGIINIYVQKRLMGFLLL